MQSTEVIDLNDYHQKKLVGKIIRCMSGIAATSAAAHELAVTLEADGDPPAWANFPTLIGMLSGIEELAESILNPLDELCQADPREAL